MKAIAAKPIERSNRKEKGIVMLKTAALAIFIWILLTAAFYIN